MIRKLLRKIIREGTHKSPAEPHVGRGSLHRLFCKCRKILASLSWRKVIAFTLILACIYVANTGRYLIWPPVSGLAQNNPEDTAFMQYRRAQWKKEGRNSVQVRWNWRSLNNISPNLRRAVIIAEDSTFWEHEGFDWDGMRNALEVNLEKRQFSMGGSTITQQLAKNLYFSPDKSITRKLQEAIMAWRLESSLSKQRILELYLNVVEWGDGVYGADAAARRWFGVSAANLSRQQAATLAAMLPNPLLRKPESRRVKRVSAIILGRM